MGTRGLWGFRKNGNDKLTYNHFDSYPSGLGEEIKKFIVGHVDDLDAIEDRIELVNEDTPPTNEQIEELKKFADQRVSTGELTEWYVLLRDTQGNPEAYSNGLKYMIDSHNFIKNSLFCEWAYIINLDAKNLELWRGFQKNPQSGNRYGIDADDGYYPCALIKCVPLQKVKSFDMKKFEKTVYNEDNDE